MIDECHSYTPDGLLATISNAEVFVEYTYTHDKLDAGYTITLTNGTVFSHAVVRDAYRRSLVTAITNSVNYCDYLGYARLLSGALLARSGKGYHNGEASARKVIRLIDWLNRKTDTKGRKCFNASIRDLVLTPIGEVKSLIDKYPDDVYITAHGGLNVNGQIWRGSSYNKRELSSEGGELLFCILH